MMNDVSNDYLNKLISTAQAYYPKFKWTTAKVNAAKANLDKTKKGVFDFISLSYVYYPNNSLQVYNGSSVSSFFGGYQAGLFVNVGNMLQKPATIRQAREEYYAAGYDKEAADLNLVVEVKKRYYTYVQSMNVLKVKTRAISDAEDLQRNIKYRFEKGEVTLEIYSQTLLTFSTQSQEKLTAEANMLIAKASLEELLGTTLENIK
jgi:outer membrane protein TolC